MARNLLLPLVFLVGLGVWEGSQASSQDSVEVVNGSFDQWKEGSPVGWTVETGATNGAKAPKSEVKQIPGPALMLRGNASTKAWQSVSQAIDVTPGETFRLTFLARAKDVRREGQQFDNCHVGWLSTDAAGKIVDRSIVDVSTEAPDWRQFEVEHLVPAGADKTTVYVFLSKSGILGVKDVKVEKTAADSTSLLRNADFGDWQLGRPIGWEVEVSANNGGSKPESIVRQAADNGLQLSGTRQTLAWNSVSQTVSLQPGKAYELRFEAVATGVRKEGRQFDNCYVGVMHFGAGGKRLGLEVEDLSRYNRMRTGSLSFRVPANCTSTKVLVFLSKTGVLTIQRLTLAESSPKKPFAQLMDSLRKHYSFTELKGVVWEDLQRQFETKVDEATTPEAFAAEIIPMLSQLKDLHVTVELPGGIKMPTYFPRYQLNVDRSVVRDQLDSVKDFDDIGFLGSIGNTIVIFVEGLPSDGDYEAVSDAVLSFGKVDGYIIDLRMNRGGNEARAAEIAGLFVDQPVVYARSLRRRDGVLQEGSPRYLEPCPRGVGGDVPIVCLIGSGCVSSGEGMALMFKAIEQSVVLGQPSRGASGNPSAVELSNGVKVWFSRWQSLEVDGTPIEGRGVVPDETFVAASSDRAPSLAGRPNDPVIDRALQILNPTE